MFPSDWGAKSSLSKKRKADEDADSPPTALSEDVLQSPEEIEICRRILSNLNKGKRVGDLPEQLNLETLLSSMSYRSLLCNMIGIGSNKALKPVNLPLITKAYEESYLREPMGTERKCASNLLCEGLFIDSTKPFILPEFILPGEHIISENSHPQLCVLCSRKVTQQLYYDLIYSKQPFPNALIQRYGNICGPGEYAQESLLITPFCAPLVCMPLPMMSHQRNKYVVTTAGGYNQIQQVNVAFEDFHRPSINDQT